MIKRAEDTLAGGVDVVRIGDDRSHKFSDNEEQQDRARPPILPPPWQPMQCARQFLAQNCLRDGVPMLRYWRDGWWAWRTSYWNEIDRREVRSLLYTFTERAFYLGADYVPKEWAPNRRKIGDLLEALGAICILSGEFDQPTWLDQRATAWT
jgi:putative DNA primase/helicase